MIVWTTKPRLRDYADQPQCYKPPSPLTQRQRDRLDMASGAITVLVAVLVLSALAHCQDFPDAPEPQHNRTFSREYLIAYSVNAGVRVADAAVTCHSASRPNFHELTAPSQTCAGISAWVMAGVPAQIATVALLNHYHHYKAARWAAWFYPAIDVPGLIYTATNQRPIVYRTPPPPMAATKGR